MPMPWEEYATPSAAPSSAKPWEEYGGSSAPAGPTRGKFDLRGDGYDKMVNYNPTDSIGGLVRGSGSIGATLLAPIDAAARFINGGKPINIGGYDIAGQDRRAGMDAGLDAAGVDRNSLQFKTNKLGAEVGGTMGVGGAAANLLARIPGAATAIPSFINAIRTGGMTTGAAPGGNVLADLAVRGAGGAVNGALTAGAVDPQQAPTGALIGGTLPPAVKVIGEGGKLVGNGIAALTKNTLGLTTGAGAETFGTAYRAGRDGGTSFLDNMRGNVPLTDVLDSAKDALSKMRLERGNQYRSGMVDIANDKSVIDFAPIDAAVNSLKTMGNFKGQVINKNAAGTVDEISGLVNQWKGLNPAEYHTPEGLDALKKAIGDIRDVAQFGTPARKAADTAYNAVKDQITQQAPTYAKVMKDYGQASETLTEIEKALSLGNKAAADTSMRKLQSLMRNNVNTNYGNRLGLANTLEDHGADILPAVAGQAASSLTPRGLQGLAATGAGLASFTNPMTLAALPFTSPRLMGELSYGLGAMSRFGGSAGNALQPAQQGLLAGGQPSNNLLGLLNQGVYRAAPLLGAESLVRR